MSPSVGDVLGAAGACPEVEYNGTVWKVGHPTQAAKDRLEKLVVAAAWENVQAAKTGIAELDGDLVADFHRAVQNREYRTGGSRWAAAFNRPDGQVLFLLSLLREHHPRASADDVIRLLRDRGEEMAAAVIQVTPGFFLLVAKELNLPPEWADRMAVQFRAASSSSTAPSGP